MHTGEADALVTATACTHHHEPHEQDHPEEEQDCGLCSLVVLSADIPLNLILQKPLFTPGSYHAPAALPVIPSIVHSGHARAPPFMTV